MPYKLDMKFKHTSLTILLIIPALLYAQSDPRFLDQKALQGTLQISYNNSAASSFQYKGNDSVGYLITAKHVFKSKFKRKNAERKKISYSYYDSLINNDGDKVDVSIYYSGGWVKINAWVYFDNNKGDVAVLKTNIPMAGNNYDFDASGLYVSQECYFIGFPLGLRMDLSKKPGFTPYPIPFVRKGIISALGNFDDGFSDKYYIDGHNTYGFSGGPLIYYNYSNNSYHVAGVISGYVKQENYSYKENGSVETTEENSGLMEVSSIEYAKKILRRIKCMK